MGPLILVTGSTDGIGKETASVLAERGARVIVHGRDATRVAEAAAAVTARGGAAVEQEVADLSSLADVRSMAERLRARHGALDVLVNNAGVLSRRRVVTGDGFEQTFAVNHLAPVLLTHLLLPALQASDDGRVVNVSSGVHAGPRLDWDDLQSERDYDGTTAYALSKLANVLFTVELARRLRGRPTVNSLHPGVVATKLLRAGWGGGGRDSAGHGAATSVHLALDPIGGEVTGQYFVNCAVARESPLAHDPAVTARFYELSCRMAGVAPLPP